MIGKRGRVIRLMLGLASAVVVWASVGSASAATNVPVWTAGGAGVQYGAERAFHGESIVGLNLRYNISATAEVWVTCSTLSATGAVENPAAGKPGLVFGPGGLNRRAQRDLPQLPAGRIRERHLRRLGMHYCRWNSDGIERRRTDQYRPPCRRPGTCDPHRICGPLPRVGRWRGDVQSDVQRRR